MFDQAGDIYNQEGEALQLAAARDASLGGDGRWGWREDETTGVVVASVHNSVLHHIHSTLGIPRRAASCCRLWQAAQLVLCK
jgi:hypothetical protein